MLDEVIQVTIYSWFRNETVHLVFWIETVWLYKWTESVEVDVSMPFRRLQLTHLQIFLIRRNILFNHSNIVLFRIWIFLSIPYIDAHFMIGQNTPNFSVLPRHFKILRMLWKLLQHSLTLLNPFLHLNHQLLGQTSFFLWLHLLWNLVKGIIFTFNDWPIEHFLLILLNVIDYFCAALCFYWFCLFNHI